MTDSTHKANIDDDLWKRAKKKAKAEGRTIDDVLADALRRYTSQRAIPISDNIADGMRNIAADRPAGSVFPAKTAALRTFLPAGSGRVLFDSGEVSGLLRSIGTSLRAPVYRGVAQDLEQLAEALDLQALQALDDTRGDS